jgi:hypothetical protein
VAEWLPSLHKYTVPGKPALEPALAHVMDKDMPKVLGQTASDFLDCLLDMLKARLAP